MRFTRYFLPLVFAAGCSSSDNGSIADASLTVTNDSDFTIIQLYLTEVDNPDFGPNLLRGDPLQPGEQVVLGVPCDTYDALLIDEDNVDCEIHDIDLCLNDADFVIRNNTCAVFGAARAARQAQAAKQP